MLTSCAATRLLVLAAVRRLYMLMDCITTGALNGLSLASVIELDPRGHPGQHAGVRCMPHLVHAQPRVAMKHMVLGRTHADTLLLLQN